MNKTSGWYAVNVCDWFVGSFAVWTILTNLTALTSGGLLHLLLSSGSTIGVWLCWWGWQQKHHRSPVGRHVLQSECPDIRDRRQFVLFWLIVGLSIALTLVAHRPDADDAFYVNVAVVAVDAPHTPILSIYTMSAPPQPAMFSAYKMQAFEMLGAACAWLTHTPAIVWFHLIFSPLAALFTMLAYRDLLRLLVPKYYAYGVLAVFLFLCANGNVHASYGNLSFVRLHQGKGIFVSAILPLLLAYGIRFARQPDKKNWLMLSSAQITAIGMTSTALWVAPTVAAFAVLAGLPKLPFTTQVKRLGLGLTTSAYLVGIGLYLRLAYPLPERAFATRSTGLQLLDSNLQYVFGYNRFALACLMIALTAWIFCESRLARRLCLVFPLGVGLLFANPLAASVLATKLTGVSTYWRVFWLLPLPTIAGLFFLAPLTTTKFRWRLPIRYGIYVLLLVGFWMILPERYIFSATNYTHLGWPGLKVPETYQIAKLLSDYFDNRPNVLAPETVTAWLPTFHHHPYPLLARTNNAAAYGEEGQRRLTLKQYITGTKRIEQAQQVLQEGLQHYQIRAACFPVTNPWAEDIRAILKAANFHIGGTIRDYELWMLSP